MSDKEECIRNSINQIDNDILKDVVSIILSRKQKKQSSSPFETTAGYRNFAQAILDLKKTYSFPELNYFSTEADLVYVQAGDRRILLTDRDCQELNNHHAEKNNSNTTEKEINDYEDAFEPVNSTNSRFSHLEL